MTVIINTLKRIFINPLSIIFLFLFPVIFAVLMSLSAGDETEDVQDISFSFGAVDMDNSVLSKALIQKMESRFTVVEVAYADISAKLTEQDVPWILLLPAGYGNDILSGNTPALECYSLTLSDISAMAGSNAESITRSLMLLKTEDEKILSEWAEKSEAKTEILALNDNWKTVTFWFGFFGFVSMMTAYFVGRVLADDKKRGMPDRLGVLPSSPRKHLISGALATFAATEITVVLLMLIVAVIIGTVPNMPMLFLILSIYNLFTVSMVLAVLSFAKDLGIASVTITLTATVFSMLGGAFWPLELVPEFMKKLAWFSPTYWLTHGIGDIKELRFEGFGMSVLFLMGFTVVAILLGGWKQIQKMDEE